MILKIARYGKDAREWDIFDDIEHISYGLMEHDRNMPKIALEIQIEDYQYHPNHETQDSQVTICNGKLFMRNGKEVLFEFDTLAYLCNDDGKTIEKIIANRDLDLKETANVG